METDIIKKFIAALASMAFAISASAQSGLEGTWHGELTVPGGSLMLVFHLDPVECTIDSPDQGAYGIPAELKTLNSAKAHVEVPSLGASFEGNLMFGLLVGKFKQSGLEFSLSLKRGDIERNRPQTPAGPYPYASEEVAFTNPEDGAVLSGTLTYPADYSSETPVVLLVSGSGLQNRDEEIYSHKPFLVIADHLARNGIASLRYDDRSAGKSTGNAVGATTETFKKDALAGLEFLRDLDKFSKIGLAGHSEGGTIAFLLAGEGKTDFIISLAGTATDGATVLVEQNRKILKGNGIPESAVNDYCEVLAKLYADPGMTAEELDKLAAGLAPDMKQNIMGIRETKDPWVQHFISFDPGEAIRKIECPVMALNGENDVQVIADSNIPVLHELLKDNGKNMIKIYPGLNHLFQHSETGMPDEYGKIEETMSAEVLDDMTNWIKAL